MFYYPFYSDHVMEFVIGIKGEDFVLLGADQSAMRSVIVYQQELDKIHQISKNSGLAGNNYSNSSQTFDFSVCGEVGDTNYFSEQIATNISLYEIRNGYPMTPDEASSFTRLTLAGSLRSRKPYHVSHIYM